MPPVALHTRQPHDALSVEVYRLDNGLEVWMSVNPEEPRVFASVVARVGSGEDPPDATGLAHYMEHMLANKGTRRLGTTDYAAEQPLLAEVSDLFDALFDTDDTAERAALLARIDALEREAARHAVPNELKQVYARMGGRGFNASTSKERTNYFVDLPAGMLERWAVLESDRFTSPVFRSFFSEVQTVIEEKNRALDDPGRRSAAALDRLLWGDHPYGTETLGRGVHLARPRVSRMRRFFDDWVVPGNMAVVLAGDLDPTHALATVERHFGPLPDRPTPPRADPRLLPRLAGERSTQLVHHGQPSTHVAWRTVAFGHPDRPALRMADMVLQNGKTGLLDTALNVPKRVRASGAFPRFYRDAGAQVVWARPLDGQTLAEARHLVLEQVERLREGDLDPGLLEAIFVNWRLGELAARESNRARAGWMTAAFVQRQSWADYIAELARHEAVTVADIQRVARTYLGPDRVVVERASGTPASQALSVPAVAPRPIQTEAHSGLYHEVLAMPVAAVAPQVLEEGHDWSVARSPTGTVYANRNPHSDLCQLTWVWDSGYEGAVGRSYAVGLWARSGVDDRSRTELDRLLYSRGVRVAARCARHETQLSMVGPSAAVAELVPLVWRRWWSPAIDPVDGRAYLHDAIQRRRVDKATHKKRIGAARGRALYGTNSTALAHSPTDDQIRHLLEPHPSEPTRAHALLRPLAHQPRDILYTGAAAVDEVRGWLHPLGEARAPVPPTPTIHKARVAAPQVLLVHHAAEQVSTTVYQCAGPHRPERLPAARVLNEYLGGSAGLIFQELREARGMAYSTSGGLSLGRRPGDDDLLWAQASTHPDRTVAATELLVELLAAPIRDTGRFDRARAAAWEHLAAERIVARSVPGTVRWWATRGFSADPRPGIRRALHALDQDSVEHFRRGLACAPVVVVVVGDLERVDPAAFSALGTVRVLEDADIFGY